MQFYSGADDTKFAVLWRKMRVHVMYIDIGMCRHFSMTIGKVADGFALCGSGLQMDADAPQPGVPRVRVQAG